MEVALRECIAVAMWKANVNTGLRVSIVPLIQRVLMELFQTALKTETAVYLLEKYTLEQNGRNRQLPSQPPGCT
jgi:hypothetical protein